MKAILFALVLLCGAAVAEAGNCCGQALVVQQVGHGVVLQQPQVFVQQSAPLFVNPHAVQVLAVPVRQRVVVQQVHPRQRVIVRQRGLFGRRGVSVNVR